MDPNVTSVAWLTFTINGLSSSGFNAIPNISFFLFFVNFILINYKFPPFFRVKINVLLKRYKCKLKFSNDCIKHFIANDDNNLLLSDQKHNLLSFGTHSNL